MKLQPIIPSVTLSIRGLSHLIFRMSYAHTQFIQTGTITITSVSMFIKPMCEIELHCMHLRRGSFLNETKRTIDKVIMKLKLLV